MVRWRTRDPYAEGIRPLRDMAHGKAEYGWRENQDGAVFPNGLALINLAGGDPKLELVCCDPEYARFENLGEKRLNQSRTHRRVSGDIKLVAAACRWSSRHPAERLAPYCGVDLMDQRELIANDGGRPAWKAPGHASRSLQTQAEAWRAVASLLRLKRVRKRSKCAPATTSIALRG